MKCPNCGYFNMPGASQCGQCRRALGGATAAGPVPVQEIYPPRARSRSTRQNIEASSPAARQASRIVQNEWDRARERVNPLRSSVAISWSKIRWFLAPSNWPLLGQWWTPPLASLIPGLGQLLQRRWMTAALHLALLVPMFSALIWAYDQNWSMQFRGDLSPVAPLIAVPLLLFLYSIPFLFAVLVWYSVWDAARHSFPPAPNDAVLSRLRKLRLAAGSALFVGVALTFFFTVLNSVLSH